eukprot:403337488
MIIKTINQKKNIPFLSIQKFAFSQKSENQQTSTFNNLIYNVIEVGVQGTEQVTNFLYPPDLQKEPTKQEVVQQIQRSNHLARQTTKSISQNLDFYTNTYSQNNQDQKFLDDLRTNQEKDIDKIESDMPNSRARPSLLMPLGQAFSLLAAGSSLFLGQKYTNVLLFSIEKGLQVFAQPYAQNFLQDENDEQLRILNEKGIENHELRKQIIEIRDQSYEQFEKSNRLIDVEQIKKEKSLEYALYQAGSWATSAAMRLSRNL